MRSPMAGWLGGKYKLSTRIIDRIPPHECYIEPFAGAAWVLFRKPQEISKSEVVNDINLDLVTLYRVLQNHLEEFVRYFKWVLISRAEFERLKLVEPDTLTDIQRAARFYYLQKNAFGGIISRPSFGYSMTKGPKLNLLRIEEELSAVHLRLSGVYIEHKPYADLIQRYDRPDSFFYVDPPYWGCENDYGKDLFARDDFERLAELLRGVQGKFLLSLNDVPEVREVFKAFSLEEVSLTYSCGSSNSTKARELFIKNY